jgi:hypothetical protein
MSSPLALLVAETDVPLLSTALAAVVGAGAALAILRPTRTGLARMALVPALIAAGTSIVLACVMVVSLGYQTRFFQQRDLHEAGTGQRRTAPMPEATVAAARARLRPGETWALITPDGRCVEDSYRYLWLAFRLFPNPPGCTAPQVEVLVGVTPPAGATIMAAGAGWTVVRP